MYFCDSGDFYMGQARDGRFHGKGLFYTAESDSWELNDYESGRVLKAIKSGEGRPQQVEVKQSLEDYDEEIPQNIFIRPKDFFFEHYEVRTVNQLSA